MVDKDLLSMQEARSLIRGANAAQSTLAEMSQEQVDQLTGAISEATISQAESLAKLAVKDTGFGIWQDKMAKNMLAADTLFQHISSKKTIGIINEDVEKKILEIATPAGVIAALVPSTNPTSTTIYKAMIAIKSGNAIVFSPHPSALECIQKTVDAIQGALTSKGAPAELVSVMSIPTIQGTSELMKRADLIIATGGPGMVKAAYSSGTPALGVGAGNVPVFIERSARISLAVDRIMESKTFDNGTICASEQAIVTEKCIEDQVRQALVEKGGYFLSDDEAEKVKRIMERPDGSMSPAIVGKPVSFIAQLAGISIPENTRVMVYEEKGIGPNFPFSKEKLTTLLGYYTVENWQQACETCSKLLKNGGVGHSLAIHSENDEIIREFAMKKPVSRLLVNTPSTHGAVGLSTNLSPSLTLGCGAIGGSSTSDNVGPEHLFDIRRIAYGTQDDTALSSNGSSVESLNDGQDEKEIDIQKITELILQKLQETS